MFLISNIVLRPMTEEDQELVMNWRMQPEITRYMNTDPVLDIEKQKKWFAKQQADASCYHWIIESDGEPIGVTSITMIDKDNRTCTRGTYVAVHEKRSFEIITSIYASQFDFIFYDLGLNKIEIQVFEANKGVVAISKKCGFKQEGLLREHVWKNGQVYNVVLLGMTKADWEEKKKTWQYQSVEIIVPERN